MKEALKRYGMAILLLLFVSGLMLIGTIGVKMFGDKMFEGTEIKIEPRGENLAK